MITVTIKRTGVLRKAWRMKITGGNNEPLGHSYDEARSAVDTAKKMFASDEPVRLRVFNEDGTVKEVYIR